MARQRRAWESLSENYRRRLSRNGISKRDYERGRNLSAARGHYATPEHGLKSAQKNPGKYGDYIRKRSVPGGGSKPPPTPEEEAHELNQWKDQAFEHMKALLHDLPKYYEPTVEANVYGGVTRESGEVPGMHLGECKWTVQASKEELRAHAYPQYKGNPWWYHLREVQSRRTAAEPGRPGSAQGIHAMARHEQRRAERCAQARP